MAGPGIRAVELSRQLSLTCEVVLASTARVEIDDLPFRTEYVNGSLLRQLADKADVIVFQGFVLALNPWLAKIGKVLVADLYDPMHIEHLEELTYSDPPDSFDLAIQTTAAVNDQLRKADFFICASEKQRDYWLGQLSGLGRVNYKTYAGDKSLRKLIDVVPFGIPSQPPLQRVHAIKGEIAGINESDKVIIWGGGIYNWFDPLSLIRAIDLVRHKDNSVRLFFLGLKHPSDSVTGFEMSSQAEELSNELGLTGKYVFFNENWVPYEHRADYLLDADLGVSTHFQHLETSLSYRTRILDYIWAGIPILTTSGDTFAEIVSDMSLGKVVPPGDVEQIAEDIFSMLNDVVLYQQIKHNVLEVGKSFTWEKSALPLVQFCESPTRAADLLNGLAPVPLVFRRTSWFASKLRAAKFAFRNGGIRNVFHKTSSKLFR